MRIGIIILVSGVRVPAPLFVFKGATGDYIWSNYARGDNTATSGAKKPPKYMDGRCMIIDSTFNKAACASSRPCAQEPNASKSWLSLSG